MALRGPQDLRDSANEFRELVKQGSDIRLHAALLLVAEEFEREADRLERLESESKMPP